MNRLLPLLAAGGVFLLAAPAVAAPPPDETIRDANEVLTDMQALKLKGIPPALMADAQAVVVIPRVIKAGFVVGGRGGHGLALCRVDGGWTEPTFLHIGGASVGFQIGVQATDLVLVFKNRKALERVLDGKGKLTLGADAGVSAGPLGRQVEAGTDGKLQAEIYSYSRSRGLFAGVALDGAVLASDPDANRAFRRDYRPETTGKAVSALVQKLAEMGTERPDAPPAVPPTPPTVVVPPGRPGLLPPAPPPQAVPDRAFSPVPPQPLPPPR